MTLRFIRAILILAALALGWYGLSQLWAMPRADQLSIIFWLAGGLIVHDALFAPACIALGYAAKRVLPQRWWPPALLAVTASLVVLILSLPVLLPRSPDKTPDNATILDRPYGVSVVIALTVIWLLAVSLILARRRRPAAASTQRE
ncbi:hypothetical protein [Williamsia sp. 1135]|uniref:hypothetical protein n=1 Tax=Williamsia sp. 1135 TaxID=1889262 RepID=UPI000A107CBF|nr:hypothetical protein [Williamsia sp. 1135]ORM30590.1 hypothetical protein BFL43_18320 [Williamsia sp. 1135]